MQDEKKEGVSVKKIKTGIIGCGVISHTYIRDIQRLYKGLEICACAHKDRETAKKHGEKYGIPLGYTVEELLNDREIEIVINLTPPLAHGGINGKVLEAGKRREKPFAGWPVKIMSGPVLLRILFWDLPFRPVKSFWTTAGSESLCM